MSAYDYKPGDKVRRKAEQPREILGSREHVITATDHKGGWLYLEGFNEERFAIECFDLVEAAPSPHPFTVEELEDRLVTWRRNDWADPPAPHVRASYPAEAALYDAALAIEEAREPKDRRIDIARKWMHTGELVTDSQIEELLALLDEAKP